MRFENSFQSLPPIFYEQVKPTPLTEPKLVCVSESCRSQLQLELPDPNLLAWLNGQLRIPGDQQISTRYAGHQFGHWAGQLGDGRAISLGELKLESGRYEIQTKGSGLTPFSRMGDGKAVIRSSVREFLASEAMHFLGVPTTRALALITGTDPVERENIERAAVVARVFPSNLRFGHFEYAHHFKNPEALEALIKYTQKYFFPMAKSLEDMLLEVTSRTASMIALWQSIGFCHGVMNTDNLSILGITIDYGPFGFMENFNPAWICNHSDHQGRYTYQNQAYVGLWNLDRLMTCFSNHLSNDALTEILKTYESVFWETYYKEFFQKLGIENPGTEDQILVQQFLALLEKYQMDFTHSFRSLSKPNKELIKIWNQPELLDWLHKYSSRQSADSRSESERIAALNKKNPKYVLRNYIAQEVIADVESGHSDKIHLWMKILKNPYEEHSEFERYSQPTPAHLQDFEISCSS